MSSFFRNWNLAMFFFVFFSLLPLFFFTLFLFKWLSNASPPSKKLPPSPPKLPIIGNLHQLGSHPHRSLCSFAKKYGPLMLLQLGKVPVLVVSSADAACEIMKTHDLIFSSRPKLSIPNKLLYHDKDVAFTPYGEYWRQVKSFCVLHLLSNRRVESFRDVRKEETDLMIEKIRESSSSSSLINLKEVFVSLTNDTVCRVALGRKWSGSRESSRKLKEMLGEFTELLGVFNVGDYIPWLAWANRINGLDAKVEGVAKWLDEFLEGLVKEHMDQTRRESDGGWSQQNFVDVLLEVQRNNTAGFPVRGDTVKALILDMFAAGTDTTYTVLEWLMTELLRHPTIMKKLQNEVREIGRGKLDITEDDLGGMPYLKAVIKETLRLHPPIPILLPRESTQDVNLMGYDIAAGTQVLINDWAIGRDPLSWEEPDEFQPERFLFTSIDVRGHDFKLIPFGAGRRGCPGTQFATSILQLALAKLVHNFDWALPDGARGEDLDMTEGTGITIHRKNPLFLVATPYSC